MNRYPKTYHRSLLAPATLLLAATMLFGGCRNELFDQEYGEPLEKSEFFADKRMSRPLVDGTVPQGHLNEDDLLYGGKDEAGNFSEVFPMEVTREMIDRGQERYDIYCSPCHGQTGRGDGIIVRRGMKQPPSFHEQRLVDMPAGYFFDVITHGFGVMYSYASRVKPVDRWAIVAYVRALQRLEPPIASAPGPDTATATTAATGVNATESDRSNVVPSNAVPSNAVPNEAVTEDE